MSAIDEFLSYDEEAGISKEANIFARGLRMMGFGARPVAETAAREVAPVAASVAREAVPAVAAAAPKSVGRRFLDQIKHIGSSTAQIGVPALALGGAMAGSESLINAASSTISRSRGYQGMMENNPELGKMDQKRVSAAFKTLHRFNPEMASDPYVAGGWVKRVTDYDYVDPKTIGDLVAARSRATKPGVMERGLPLAIAGSSIAEGRGMADRREGFDTSKLMLADAMARQRDQTARNSAQDVAMAQAQGKLTAEHASRAFTEDVERRKAFGKAKGTAQAARRDPSLFREAVIPGETGKLMAQRDFAVANPAPGSLEYQKSYAGLMAQRDFMVENPNFDPND